MSSRRPKLPGEGKRWLWPLAAAIVTLSSAAGERAARAEGTVVIGGSGRPGVEVRGDLGGAGSGGAYRGSTRGGLLYPGQDPANGAVFQLRPPGSSTRGTAGRGRGAHLKLTPPTTKSTRPAKRPTKAKLTPPLPPPTATRPAPSPTASAPAPTVAAPPPPPPPSATTQPARTATTKTAVPKVTAPPPPPPLSTAKVAPKAEVPAPTTTTSALPSGGGLLLEIPFAAASMELDEAAAEQLRGLAARMKSTSGRLLVKAFASLGGGSASQARRTSLSRGLVVRSYLVEEGVRSTRIDVLARGVPRDGGNEDRVDVILTTR